MGNVNGRPCPVCGSGEKQILSELCGNLKILGSHFPNSPSDNVVCQRCGIVYVDMSSSQADFDTYYGSIAKPLSYADTFGQDEAAQYFETIYQAIAPYIGPESRILDLGCGSGEFSKLLLAKGHRNVVAADLSQACVDIARKAGVEAFLYNVTVPDRPEWEKTFDLIVYSHTIEHVFDVGASMRAVKKLLKDDGVLFVEVPDAEKYSAVDLGPYFFFTYEHLMHLTGDTLRNISRVFGYELLQTRTYLKCNRYYVIYGIYRNGGDVAPVLRETANAAAVSGYEDICRGNLASAIQGLETGGEELILWGVGSSTAQLLNGHFDRCKVIKLVDSNPTRQGIEFKINGKILKIEPPESITNTSATIVVLPFMFRDSIVKQIRASNFTNKLATLAIT